MKIGSPVVGTAVEDIPAGGEGRMKINDQPEIYEIFPGDKILIGVTHEIQIRGDKSWVRGEGTIAVQAGETTEHAKKRAIGFVTDLTMEAVAETVARVESLNQ